MDTDQSLIRPCEGGWLVYLGKVECTMLQRAISDVFMLIDSSQLDPFVLSSVTELYDEPLPPPENKALRMILPDMSTDREYAQQLRALTEEGLRTEKADRLEWMAEHLVTVRDNTPLFIEDGDEWTWLGGINDVRHVLATSLHINDDDELDLPQSMEQDTAEFKKLSPSRLQLIEKLRKSTGQTADATVPEREDVVVRALYDLLTTWQESLLVNMEARRSDH